MIIDDFKDFPRKGRILGIDWGARRMGLAVSDERREFVFPRPVNSDIAELIKSERIVGIVIGLPTHADGTDSETTRAVRKFASELQTPLPIMFVDERLSSVAAMEKTNKKSELDSESAAIILEDFISALKRS